MKNFLVKNILVRVIAGGLSAGCCFSTAMAQEQHAPPAHVAHGQSRLQGHPGGHYSDGHGGWIEHPGWHGDIHNFDHGHWRGGHWWHGGYGGRDGWWWIVGPDWYWYSAPVYPYPDAYVPPGMTSGYWYWCEQYQDYYPNVGACPSGWQAEPAQQ
jgi:hypothetical protein